MGRSLATLVLVAIISAMGTFALCWGLFNKDNASENPVGISRASSRELQSDDIRSTSTHKQSPCRTAERAGNCVLNAFNKYPSRHQTDVRPMLFVPLTRKFSAIYFSVPGDEPSWSVPETNARYPWRMTTVSLVWVGDLYLRAQQKGFDLKGDTLIDVGGNMGQEAVVATLNGAKSITFEAMPQSVEAIKFNMAANCIDTDKFRVVWGAVGTEKGGYLMINTKEFTPAAQLHNNTGKIKVPMKQIDDVLFESSKLITRRPLLYKLDCEGCEVAALNTSSKLLKDFPPHYIMMEYSTNSFSSKQLLPWITDLMKMGYSRAFVLDVNDGISKDVETEDDRIRFWETPYSAEACGAACDIVFVHDDAIDLGFPLEKTQKRKVRILD